MEEISESALQQRIFMHHWNTCPDERGLLFHVNNNAKNRRTGAILKGIGVIAGVADLLYVYQSRLYAFEVKLPSGKQSKVQRDWQKAIEAAGCEYYIIRSVEDFDAAISKIKKGL